MKTTLLALVLAVIGFELWAQTPPGLPAPGQLHRPPRFGTNNPALPPRYTPPATATTPTLPAATATPAASAQPEEIIPANTINWQDVDLNQVLEIYAQYVGRTLIRGQLPGAKITLKTQTALTKTEVIQAIQAVLALNGVSVVNVGDKFVKVGGVEQVNTFGAPFSENDATNLPELGSYVTHIVQLKYVKPTEMVPLIQPFAKLANSILPIDSNGILVLRDNAENVKRMLEMIDRIDVSVPAEYTSEVIPIRYAEASDIASALNSLGGNGGSTVSFGGSSSSTPINGLRGGSTGTSGFGTSGGFGGSTYPSGSTLGNNSSLSGARPFGTTTATGATGTPTGGTTFQQRLQSIINRASGGSSGGADKDQIQVFGQAKIIADQRSNSLLVFASRQDIERIKQVISQLDVLLAQVLIESIIMDVDIGHTFDFGVNAAQQPKAVNSDVTTAGAMNNGGPFYSFLRGLSTNSAASGTNSLVSSFVGSLPGGFSYFGNIGQTWDLALTAAQSDNNASIIQRPRIQTSQAKPAQFFVGQTVPYVNNTYNNVYSGGYGGSSYSQLSVGVELDVTPFINPDGLVVMDIQQEIDEISGYTLIDNNKVPNTIKRTLSTEIAVRNRDTVILGGFVRSDKSHGRSGVPFLMDIPLLGKLFTSSSDSKDRTELIVLMRPTVLKTPEIAAAQTIKEAQRLPGVSAAAAENAEDERNLIDAERKRELKRARSGKSADGFFNMKVEEDDETNAPLYDFGSAPHARPAPPATNSKSTP